MSSNLLAIVLVIAAESSRGNLDCLKKIADVVHEHKGLPGYENVQTALDFVCDCAREGGRGVTFERFDQFRVRPDEEVQSLINGGENDRCEFKSTLRVNLKTGTVDKKIEQATLKTVTGFLNTRGGSLLIGVNDAGEALDIDKDRFESRDRYALHFKNLVVQTMGGAMDFIEHKFVSYRGSTVFLVRCLRSDQPVYLLNRETNEEEFYVRRGHSTDRLGLREAVKYIHREFREGRVT
jgi:hypothetical protein